MLGVITPVRNKVAGISQAELSPEPHFALDTACLRLAPSIRSSLSDKSIL
jgi:hypothetical protein